MSILLLLLRTTSPWICLQHSRNLGSTFKQSPVHVNWECAASAVIACQGRIPVAFDGGRLISSTARTARHAARAVAQRKRYQNLILFDGATVNPDGPNDLLTGAYTPSYCCIGDYKYPDISYLITLRREADSNSPLAFIAFE